MASLRPKRTAVKSAASPKRRQEDDRSQAATGDSSSETEVRAEAKEALARLVSTKRQELQSIRLQAKVQQLAQLRRRLQEQKVAVTASNSEDLNERDVARQREESCRRLRQTLLQSLKKKQEEDQDSDELSETLVVLESDVEPPTAKKRMLEEERQPVQLKAASKVPRLVAAKPLRLTPRQGS
ncbi:unnamed protein product [Cladocopium goreaui]|uniref:Uncharacterized protein n=1 Tax=Cladocopium goreaui TaxID=2562237 RepID=A0A9P1DNZ4_9DINO|nr:unnamed protein product [Cladocopium goreaui]|mmetsp:Transcript_32711/g.67078  ORF Transcript_32711/g.67078 Transcript_32711/m.67078 type:complete len:183 (+) Transcript_32711:54-602(+)